MIYLILLQIFSAQIDSAITSFHKSDYQKAYHIAYEIPVDSTEGLEYYEVQELRAYTSLRLRKFRQADSLFQISFKTENKNLLRKAYTNYAELQHIQFNFDKRILYLQKAYNIEPTNQLIRIIAKHYFQIEADYELAEIWLDRHTIPKDAKDSSGYYSTLAQLAEAKRRYNQALEYYTKAKISAKEANLFNYELFASEGLYRSERLLHSQDEKKMINRITWFILGVIIYYYVKKLKKSYVRVDQSKDKSRHLNY